MKKILLFASALAGLFLAGSCQRENLEPMESANTVTYTVTVPDALATKGIGDDISAVDELVYEVYRTQEEGVQTFTNLDNFLYHKTAPITNGVATIELEFVNNQNFTVLFWAHTKDNGVYDVDDLTCVTIESPDAANNVNAQAFVGRDFVRNCVSDADGKVTLTRPVSQLNIATTPESLGKFQDVIELQGSSVKVTGLATSYNIGTLSAFGATATEYEYTRTAVPEEALTVNGVGYTYVAMNYVGFAANDGSSDVKVSYVINTSEGDIENEIINVPFKPNFRTNIIGNLITSKTAYTIELDETWGDPDQAPDAIYMAAALGGELTLTGNITLPKPLVIKSSLVLNLGGKTITGGKEYVSGTGMTGIDISAITVDNGATLTIEGEGSIQGTEYGVYAKNGNLVIKSGNFSASTSAVQIAAANVNIEGGTFSNTGSDKRYVINCLDANWNNESAKVNITGGTFNNFNPADNAAEGLHTNFVATGYKAISAGDNYHVFPEFIANAATAANVTAVTKSTADVATALTTDNGEATMFMWNDVAYIAKYGEVVITSAADEATTVRGVVEGAAGLETAKVAEGIEVVGNRTFRKCANLKTVVFPNTLTEIGPAVFQSCSKLANVTIPASVTTIGESAFAECTSLTSINIPDGITRLEKDVLRNTGLVSIEIPASVNYIGTFAFRDCKQLKEVVIKAPEFTVEANAFGVMSGALPGTTIYVANAEMKAYLESTLAYKNQFTIVAPNSVSNAEGLTEALANGENVVMTQDITTEAATTAPYGNKYAFKLDGGVLDGNGHELQMECYGDDYGIMTSGGTIKNLTIKEGCRAVMIMYPQQDVILDHVNIGGAGVLYPINTGEAGAEGVNLVVTNSVLAGWTSFSLIESASFTNVEFKQGTYYNNIYGRVLKPYVNTTLTNCAFVEHMNLDLSSLTAGHKVIMTNCTVNGQAVTADVFTVPTTDSQYDTELFTIDLPSWASSINDCVVFN